MLRGCGSRCSIERSRAFFDRLPFVAGNDEMFEEAKPNCLSCHAQSLGRLKVLGSWGRVTRRVVMSYSKRTPVISKHRVENLSHR